MKKKKTKFRENVKKFVDCDYKHKMNKEELAFYEKFEREYYSNEINRKGSLHKEILSDEDFKRCKKETFDANNAQNRDVYAIASTSNNYLNFMDDGKRAEVKQPEKSDSEIINKLKNPDEAYQVFLCRTIDEINNESGRELKIILVEFALEVAKISLFLKRESINKILKTKENK